MSAKIFFNMALMICVFGGVTVFAETRTFDVGLSLRLNDQYNDTTQQMKNGIVAAKSLFEKKNKDTKIKFHYYSHEENLASVLASAEKAIKDNVPVVIGGEHSDEAIVLKDTLGPKKIVFMTPTSSNPSVTENAPYAFRACFRDDAVSEKLADFTLDYLKAKSIGVIYNVSTPYSDYLGRAMVSRLSGRKDKEKLTFQLTVEKIGKEKKDFEAEIKSFIANHVTHVVMLSQQEPFVLFAIQAAKLNFHPVYIGSDSWGDNFHIHRKLVEETEFGSKFVAYQNYYWNDGAKSALLTDFKNEYQKLYKKEPTAFSAMAFDAAWVVFTAMKSALNPRSGDSVRDALLKVKNLKLTTTSSFSFKDQNSPKSDLYIYKIDRSGIHYEASLK